MRISVLDSTHYGLEHIFIAYIQEYLSKQFALEELEVIAADTGCPVKIR